MTKAVNMDIPSPSDVNMTAVAVATLLVLALSIAWYRPRPSAYTKAELSIAIVVTVALAFFAVLTQSVVAVTHSPHYWDPVNGRINTWRDGVRGAGFIWGAWVLPVLIGLTIWAGRPWKAFARDATFVLAALLISGAIVAQW